MSDKYSQRLIGRQLNQTTRLKTSDLMVVTERRNPQFQINVNGAHLYVSQTLDLPRSSAVPFKSQTVTEGGCCLE